MSTLRDIGIKVVYSAPSRGTPGAARAVLHQIEAMLETLGAFGQADSIDLRRLPLEAQDYEELRETLGQGEVSARLDSLGATHVWETAVPGVWWLTHYNRGGEIIAEFIEVTEIPEILRTPPDDIRAAPHLLRSRLAQRPTPKGSDVG
jgi:HupH hydrogenase expression protein